MRKITEAMKEAFQNRVIEEEKASATVQKYLRDLGELQMWLGERELCRSSVLAYKAHLCKRYAPASVNAALSAINSFFHFTD